MDYSHLPQHVQERLERIRRARKNQPVEEAVTDPADNPEPAPEPEDDEEEDLDEVS